jgi:hypothetical protein
VQERRTEDLQARLPQRRTRRDHVGHRIRHAQGHRGLDRTVQGDEVDGDAALVEEAVDQARVGRRDARALQVGDVGEASGGARETEGGIAEPQRLDLARARHACVEQ